MALPVVLVASGGLPVTQSAAFGLPIEVAGNGFGVAVTLVATGGLPVVLLTGGLSATIAGLIGVAGDLRQTNLVGAALSAAPAIAGDISLSAGGGVTATDDDWAAWTAAA